MYHIELSRIKRKETGKEEGKREGVEMVREAFSLYKAASPNLLGTRDQFH